MNGPCNWPTAGCPACDGSDCLSRAQKTEMLAWAAHDLWAATGKVYGVCEVTVLPCDNGSVLCGCGSSFRSCGCSSVPELKLPGVADSVVEVIIDGAPLPATDYRIDDHHWLVRLDGSGWPRTDPLDPDAFSVTYMQGVPPPAGAGVVTGILACHRSSCSNSACKVPKGTQTVSRQGVTMTRGQTATSNTSRPWRYTPDAVSVFGIPEVDQWVTSANAPLVAGAVHSPDIPQPRQITWEAPVSP